MFVIQLLGGLGNQLFIYAMGLYVKKATGKTVVFDDSNYKFDFRKNKLYYFNTVYRTTNVVEKLLLRKKVYTFLSVLLKRHIVSLNAEPLRNELDFFNAHGIHYLSGYWQQKKYFLEVLQEMKVHFELKDQYKNETYYYYLQKIQSSLSLSIHIRKGDYLDAKNNTLFADLSIAYYAEALAYFEGKGTTNFIFSDDVEWCTKNFIPFFPNLQFELVHLDIDYLEFDLMKHCKHHIIANSSFSFWAALLHASLDQQVVAPKCYYKDPKLQLHYETHLKIDSFHYL
jgi:hypothetical protein